jgi:L-alanine-DL-glutamate epimerase-like enolase superfamily enzyme
MQISHVEVIPLEFQLRQPYRAGDGTDVDRAAAIFVRIETRQGRTAWGCTAVEPGAAGGLLPEVVRACRACADRTRDLNPLNTEYALAELAQVVGDVRSALCAFDIAFYDLLSLAAGLPLYRLLGGYRQRIQTSITIPRADVKETVAMARERAKQGFRILKIKGGQDPEQDVEHMRAVYDAVGWVGRDEEAEHDVPALHDPSTMAGPQFALRLDAEGGYTVQQALDVARALEGKLEMLEQPTPAGDLAALREVTQRSQVPVLADESISGPPSALEIASQRAAHGLNAKLVTCGGLQCAHQIDVIARAAHMATMVGCVHEPALLIAAGLGLALSSPNVHYCDLDGHLDLLGDPSFPRFRLQEGWLIAPDVPGLGCTVDL